MDIPEDAPPRQHKTGRDGPNRFDMRTSWASSAGNNRKIASSPITSSSTDSWSGWGSPEGQQCIEVHDVIWDLLEGVQLDAKQRQLIWPGAKRTARKERLDLDHSVQRIQKMYPNLPGDEIEEFLLDWIDGSYDPENYSQAQLDELDKLTQQWVADHLRYAKDSKKHKRTRHS